MRNRIPFGPRFQSSRRSAACAGDQWESWDLSSNALRRLSPFGTEEDRLATNVASVRVWRLLVLSGATRQGEMWTLSYRWLRGIASEHPIWPAGIGIPNYSTFSVSVFRRYWLFSALVPVFGPHSLIIRLLVAYKCARRRIPWFQPTEITEIEREGYVDDPGIICCMLFRVKQCSEECFCVCFAVYLRYSLTIELELRLALASDGLV